MEHPDWERLVNLEYLEEVIGDPTQVFACHIDAALSQDAAGLGIGRIVGYKLLPSTKVYNAAMKEFVEVSDIRAPMYMIDGVLRICAPSGGEIDLGMARDLVLYLRGLLNIKWASMDSYQAPMFYQAFRKVKIKSGVMSVDETVAPYTEVKLAIKDERLWLPPHAMLVKELREVELDETKQKVDHPPHGSKDCSDAVAGVVYMLQRKEARYGGTGGMARKVRDVEGRGEKNVRKVRISQERRIKSRFI